MSTRKKRDIPAPKLFKALCDGNRVAILRWLAEQGQPLPVGRIAGCCSVDLSVVSRHLAVLRDAGLLRAPADHHPKGDEEMNADQDQDTSASGCCCGCRCSCTAAKPVAEALRQIASAIEHCCAPDKSKS